MLIPTPKSSKSWTMSLWPCKAAYMSAVRCSPSRICGEISSVSRLLIRRSEPDFALSRKTSAAQCFRSWREVDAQCWTARRDSAPQSWRCWRVVRESPAEDVRLSWQPKHRTHNGASPTSVWNHLLSLFSPISERETNSASWLLGGATAS